jgi:hypothetical protein
MFVSQTNKFDLLLIDFGPVRVFGKQQIISIKFRAFGTNACLGSQIFNFMEQVKCVY